MLNTSPQITALYARGNLNKASLKLFGLSLIWPPVVVIVFWFLFGQEEFEVALYSALILWLLFSLPKIFQLLYVCLIIRRGKSTGSILKSASIFTAISVVCYFSYVFGMMYWEEYTNQPATKRGAGWGIFIVPMAAPFIFGLELVFVSLFNRFCVPKREAAVSESI